MKNILNLRLHRSLQKKHAKISNDAYFITLVTHNRINLLGDISDQVMCLSHLGEIVRSTWLRLPSYYPIRLDAWVIMPNHLHAILWMLELSPGKSAAREDTLDPMHQARGMSAQSYTNGNIPSSLDSIIQDFISTSTRKIIQSNNNATSVIRADTSPGLPLPATANHTQNLHIWQPNYYHQRIHNRAELERFQQYITENPHRWCENPEIVDDL